MKSKYEQFFTAHNEHVAAVVTYHLSIEAVLGALIRRSMVHEDALERLSFAQKLSLCRALGIIHLEVFELVKKMNALRNKLAHRLGYRISLEEVHALLLASDKVIDYPDDIASLPLIEIRKRGCSVEELLRRLFHNVLLHIVESQDDNFDDEFYSTTDDEKLA